MKNRQYLKSIAYFQTKHPYLVLLLILGISLIAYVGFGQVQTVASLENMMPKNIDEIYAFNALRDQGLGQDIIAVVFQIDKQSTIIQQEPLLRKDFFIYLEQLESQLHKHTDVLRIQSPTSIFQNDVHTLSQEEFQDHIRQHEEQLSQFVSYDEQTAILLLFTDVSATDERMILLAQQVQAELQSLNTPSQLTYQLTGTPIIQQRLGELINADRDATQNISTVFVFIITALIFVSFTTAFVPIIVVTISVLWLYGVMGFFGLPISTLAGGVAAMVIGIGIDYAIHIINRFRNEKKNVSIPDAIANAVSHTGYALFGAAIATVLAFLAFLVGSMPEMGRFGLLMAIGVSLSFILAIFGLPALLVIEEKIINRFAKSAKIGIQKEYKLCKTGETK